MDKKVKNNYIEICRFLFCCMIFLHHSGFVSDTGISYIFPYGSLGADFFYIVTGYFAMVHIIRLSEDINGKMEYAMHYTIKKLFKVFPFAAIGSLSIYALYFFAPETEMSITDRIFNLQNIPFELFMTPMSGTIPVNIATYRNAPMWFLSAMAIALPLVVYLALKYMDVFKNWIVWFIPPMIYAYLIYHTEGVVTWDYYTGFLYAGVLRAFADMLLGCTVYVFADILRKKMLNKKSGQKALEDNRLFRFAATLFELILLGGIIYYCNRTLNGYDQVFTIYVMVIVLTISLSGISYTSSLGGSRFIGILGSLSMPIYCIHWAVYRYVARFYTGEYWSKIIVTFAITVILAGVLMCVMDFIHRKSMRSQNI